MTQNVKSVHSIDYLAIDPRNSPHAACLLSVGTVK